MEAMLLDNQAGFRPGRSCTEHIHVLRRVVEGCRYQKLPIVMTFVDFRKAFDSIDRKQMLKILRHYGIPDQIVKSIGVLYCDTNSTVIVDGVLSDQFEVITGVLQGDVLAPFIFIILIDWVLRQSDLDPLGFTMVPRRSRRFPEQRLSNLGFADDITLLANSVEDAQSQLNKIAQAAAEVGLNINVGKTKVMSLNLPAPKISLNDVELKVVDDFEYLGSYIASTDHDIQCRKGKAWGAFWKLNRVWQSTAPMTLKMDIFKSSVLSILLYASETWVLNLTQIQRINAFQTSCLRTILDVNRDDRVTNNEVYSQMDMYSLSYTVQRRIISFLCCSCYSLH